MYSFNVTLKKPYADAYDILMGALQAEKFGVVSDINVQAVLKNKMDVDYPGYRILGACKPGIAKQIADADPDAGVLLPCSILIRETQDGNSVIAFMDPVEVLGLSESKTVHTLAAEAKQELLAVVARLEKL
ncbi:MAG: DUF302 domain-containing protein [Gammaproteobacteria bacterium]